MQIAPNLVAFNVQVTYGSNTGQTAASRPPVTYSPHPLTAYQHENTKYIYNPHNNTPGLYGIGRGHDNNFNNNRPEC